MMNQRSVYKEVTIVASLKFSFNGKRHPERISRRPFFPFPPRYLEQPMFSSPVLYRRVDADVESVSAVESESMEKQDEMEMISPTIEDDAAKSDITKQEEVDTAYDENEEIEEENKANDSKEEAKNVHEEEIPINVSEKLVGKLNVVEENMVKIRGQVDSARYLFDDALYKIESLIQIMDIVKNNEERRIKNSEGQAQISIYNKDSKDTIDDVLELLQTPAVQNILRQVLLNVFAKR